jgi:alkyl hydroperoxide reductase subunit F
MEPFDVLVVGGGPRARPRIYASRKGIAPASSPSASAARSWTPWRSRTSSPCSTPRAPSWPPPSRSTCAPTRSRSWSCRPGRRAHPRAEPGGLATVSLANGAVLRPVRSSSRPVPAGGTWACRARRTTATRASPSARTATGRCSRASGSPSSAAATPASRPRSTWPASSATSPSSSSSTSCAPTRCCSASCYSLPNVEVILSAKTTEVLGNGEQVTGLDYEDRTTGEPSTWTSRGSSSRSACCPTPSGSARRSALPAQGDRHRRPRQTSAPGIFAAGDCTTVPYKQIVISLGAGATAALSAFDHLIRTRLRQRNRLSAPLQHRRHRCRRRLVRPTPAS